MTELFDMTSVLTLIDFAISHATSLFIEMIFIYEYIGGSPSRDFDFIYELTYKYTKKYQLLKITKELCGNRSS